MAEKLRVLVIDDSSYNRRAITEILTTHPDIDVIDSAADGEQGLKLARQHRPDLITLDIEMPRMDGFTFLRLLMSQMPTPVIMVSSHSRRQEVFQALELGALDFIAKPSRFFSPEKSPLRRELIEKALAVRSLQIVPLSQRAQRRDTPAIAPSAPADPQKPVAAVEEERPPERIVVVGASTGGPPALQSMLKAVGEPGKTAFLIAQHMPEKFTKAFADRLDRMTAVRVSEAVAGTAVRAGHAYIAGGGTHLELVNEGGELRLQVIPQTSSDTYVPSVDRLFTSAAGAFRGKLMAVVLTGMGVDGAEGIVSVHQAGGTTLAESPDTAIVYGMPKGAIATGCVDKVLPLDGIIATVHEFALGGGK